MDKDHSLDKLILTAEVDLSKASKEFEALRARIEELQLDLAALRRAKKLSEQNGSAAHGHRKKGTSKSGKGEAVPPRVEEPQKHYTFHFSSRSPITSMCLAIFKKEAKSLRLTEVEEILRKEQGYKGTRNNVWGALQRLGAKTLINKIGRGLYQLAKQE